MKQQMLMEENKDLRKRIALGIQKDDAFTGSRWITKRGTMLLVVKSIFDPSEGKDGRLDAYMKENPGLVDFAYIHGHFIVARMDDLG